MATYTKIKVQPDAEILNTSCWHVGAKAHHAEAAQSIVRWVKAKPNRYITFGGDQIEGKMVDSPHFNPQGLTTGQLDIHSQCDALVKVLRPIADKILLMQMGNHELYLLKNFDVTRYVCDQLKCPYGQYQAFLNVNGVTMFFWHGRPVLPRGAKDPIQREANQKAWLKNRLAPLAGSAQAMYMAHIHHSLIVPPLEQYALMDHGADVHGVYFKEEPTTINGETWVPADARWYVATGTLRRAGGFGYVDYAEIAGYTPAPMSYTITTLKGNRIADIRKVVV